MRARYRLVLAGLEYSDHEWDEFLIVDHAVMVHVCCSEDLSTHSTIFSTSGWLLPY